MREMIDLETMENRFKAYHDNIVDMVVKGEHTRYKKKKFPSKYRHQLELNYYVLGQEHCALRKFRTRTMGLNYSSEELLFETPDGTFCDVAIENEQERNRIFKKYDIIALKNGQVKRIVLANKDFDVLSDGERALIMYIEGCFELMERCELADSSSGADIK